MEKEKSLVIGAHISFSKSKGYLLGVIKEMLRINANGAALFVGPPQSKVVVDISEENIEQAHQLAKENNINIGNFVVHARYLVNMANPVNESNRQFSIDLMESDVKMAAKLGIGYLNFHPGSSLGKDKKVAIETLGNSINELMERTKDSNVTLLLETMMAKGNYIGKTFDELAQIISLVKNKDRIGVCIDTCHIWDGGYDLKDNLDGVLEEFDRIIGLNYLKAVHINDSKNERGTHKDRHENLGKGKIGIDLFNKITTKEELIGLPFLIETPWKDKNTPFYEEEISLLQKNYKKTLFFE